MKFIIDDKLYDTNTAELIYSYRESDPQKLAGFNTIKVNCWKIIDIYRTKKGNYFLHEHQKNKKGKIITDTERNIKRIISKLNPDKFIELFGDIEEG